MINDPIQRAIGCNTRPAQKYHHVIRKLLDPRLVIEEQIARLSFAPIATDEHDVEILQRTSIGEFRKPAVVNVVSDT